MPGFSYSLSDFHGYVLGAGVESRIRDGWSLKAEYRFADYDRKSILSLGPVDVGLKPVEQTARIGLTYKFGARDSEPAPLK